MSRLEGVSRALVICLSIESIAYYYYHFGVAHTWWVVVVVMAMETAQSKCVSVAAAIVSFSPIRAFLWQSLVPAAFHFGRGWQVATVQSH